MSPSLTVIAFLAIVLALAAFATWATLDLEQRLRGSYYLRHSMQVDCPTCFAARGEPCDRTVGPGYDHPLAMHTPRGYVVYTWTRRGWAQFAYSVALDLATFLAGMWVLVAIVEDALR